MSEGGEIVRKDTAIDGRFCLLQWQVRRVVDYIEAHLPARLENRQLADVAQLSTSHFSRVFRAATEETPHGFVNRHRIQRAQRLMITSSEKLANISIDCGFSDQAHFCRVFKRAVGESPAAWRRQFLAEGYRPALSLAGLMVASARS